MFGKAKIPAPIEKGVARVPVVMQMEALECGAASLTMVMHYYRRWIPLEQARLDCGVSMDGANAKNIMLAARSYGMKASAWRLEPEELAKEGPFPCIIHWGFNHFVVLCGFKGKRAVINDPARGRVTVEWEEFDEEFTGICLTFEPDEGFVPSGKPKSVFSYARERLKGSGVAVAFVILTTTITALISLISPAFARTFLDRLLTGGNPEWLTPFMLLFSALILISVVINWISAVYSLRIEGKMSAYGSSAYLRKVLRLPMQFFNQRLSGNIADRQATNANIASAIVKTFAPLALQALMMIFYLAVMIHYSPLLSLIGVGAILLNLGVSSLVTAKRVNITRVQQRDAAKLSSATMSGISMIETIKSSGAENGFFSRWAGYQASVADYYAFNTAYAYISTAFASLTAVTLSVASIKPIIGLIKPLLEVSPEASDTKETVTRLSGSIELNHVTFGYDPESKPLFDDFNLSIAPRQYVAIVGKSGCGKSTLVRLLLGFEKPSRGVICYDKKELSQLDVRSVRRQIGTVMQDGRLFSGSVFENIVISAPTLKLQDAWDAAEIAGIADDIRDMPMGMNTLLQDGGGTISGGQRQRLMIARAIAPKPRILIFDEATSALDSITQKKVSEALDKMKCTRIVIAHRLSTIRHCDRILVIDGGKIAEDGTYEQLIARNGIFAELVERQRLDAPQPED